MKTTNKLIVGLLLVSSMLFNSCTKPKDGAAGKDGNANVTSVLLTSAWGWDGTYYYRYSSWSGISILSSDVINSGAVMLYQQLSSGSYLALPVTANSGSTQEHDYFIYQVNSLTVFIENANLTDPNPPVLNYKLVCIPQKAMKIHPNVNLRNYEEVARTFNIK